VPPEVVHLCGAHPPICEYECEYEYGYGYEYEYEYGYGYEFECEYGLRLRKRIMGRRSAAAADFASPEFNRLIIRNLRLPIFPASE
jgi:hypothetical protein